MDMKKTIGIIGVGAGLEKTTLSAIVESGLERGIQIVIIDDSRIKQEDPFKAPPIPIVPKIPFDIPDYEYLQKAQRKHHGKKKQYGRSKFDY